jgi:hypothetical protein
VSKAGGTRSCRWKVVHRSSCPYLNTNTGKRQDGWEDNIKVNLKIIWAWEHEEDSTGSGQGTIMEYCNLGNIYLRFTQEEGNFLINWSTLSFLKKDSDNWINHSLGQTTQTLQSAQMQNVISGPSRAVLTTEFLYAVDVSCFINVCNDSITNHLKFH